MDFTEILKAPTFVVNLDRCGERWTTCSKRIEEAGFTDVRRWRGVDAQNDDLKAVWLEALDGIEPRFSVYHTELVKHPGTQGCLLSHLLLWKKIIREKIPLTVVLEDDVMFHPQWSFLAPMYYDETPKIYDILYMGSQRDEAGDGSYVDRVPVFCTHAYVITLEGAKKLIRALLTHPWGFYAIDCMLIDYMKWERRTGQSAPFVWYSWNGTLVPTREAQMEEGWDKRNSGLVFQDYSFPSDVRTTWTD